MFTGREFIIRRNMNFLLKRLNTIGLRWKMTTLLFTKWMLRKFSLPIQAFQSSPTFWRSTFFSFFELKNEGDVFFHLSKCNFCTENNATDVRHNLLYGVWHLHSHSIFHRDLMPDNLLLLSGTEGTGIKLANFGFSRRGQSAYTIKTLKMRCGTLSHVEHKYILRGRLTCGLLELYSIF